VGLAALGAGAYFGRDFYAPAPAAAAGAAVYGVTLPDLDGKPITLAQFRGKPLVVNFWATWCGPCREEMPAFIKMQQADGGKNLQFVGIGVDDGDKLRQFASSIGLNYPSLVGGYGALELSRTLGNTAMALPFTLVLDREGKIVHTQLGPLPTEQLAGILAQLR
jgi:thiol-disulfide isomerase/thioredoxin